MKFRATLFVSVLLMGTMAMGQIKLEREHRVKKSQFPENGRLFMESKIGPVKKLRYYREVDSTTIHYSSKFKKDRLHYGVHFSEDGEFQKVDITVKEIDIPQDSWVNITSLLEQHFTKYRIKKILQQYKVTKEQPEAPTLKKAFQNLILPDMSYLVWAKGKTDDKCQEYRVLVNAEGNLLHLKKALPQNYDHILY